MSSPIPAALIPALRVALQSQGFPAQTLRDDGTLNPAGLLAGVYDEVEFRSQGTPTIRLKTNQLLSEGPPNPVVTWLKPTIVLRGKGQETLIAPVGVSAGGGWVPMLLMGGLLIGTGYMLAKL